MARVKTLSVNHPLAKELDKFPNFDKSGVFMPKLTKKQDKDWERSLEIANNHGFLYKKSVKELANQAYNNSLNKLGNYHK